MICKECGLEKYANHVPTPPNAGDPSLPNPCEGYEPTYACGNCGRDVERHEPDDPHQLIITVGQVQEVVCEAVVLPDNWPDTDPPAFEGGGGSGGGGGASGGW